MKTAGEFRPPSTCAPSTMDASKPTPRSGENVSDVPYYYQETLQTVVSGQFDHLQDRISEVSRQDSEEFDRGEMLREVRDIQAELEIVATLLEGYPEDPDE
jgi:hypothetical protein